MSVTEHNNVVKAVPPDRADKPLRISVLPRRSRCDRPIPNAHRSKAAHEDLAIDAIPIANDVSRRLLPAISLGELMGNPCGIRMRGHTQPQKLAAGMLQD